MGTDPTKYLSQIIAVYPFLETGKRGVTILPKEFCSEAQVVSLLRGLCTRYSPGARQAAAY